MDVREFCKKFCGNCVLKYKQATIDCMEEVEETLDNEDFNLKTKVGAARYSVETLMEICDPALPDKEFLSRVLEALNLITEE